MHFSDIIAFRTQSALIESTAHQSLHFSMSIGGMNKSNFPSGEWNGFYLEKHRSERGWMHLYLAFVDESIKGEGTDYVGPWTCSGTYDPETNVCVFKKDYLGKHSVTYSGHASENGIVGQWEIACLLSGEFHIWPRSRTDLNELYLQQDLDHSLGQAPPAFDLDREPSFDSTMQLGTVPDEDFLA